MTKSQIGKVLYIANELPVTNDAAGFEALTWTKVAGGQELPQFGFTNANIDVEDIETGDTVGVKGAASGQDSTMTFREVDGDAGQALCKTIGEAHAAAGDCSVKLIRFSDTAGVGVAGDPVEYAQGYLHSYLPNPNTVSSYAGFSTNFKQNARAVNAVEPA